MPKVPVYALAWSSTTAAYELYEIRNREALSIVPDSPEWLTWLDQVSSFAFRISVSSQIIRVVVK